MEIVRKFQDALDKPTFRTRATHAGVSAIVAVGVIAGAVRPTASGYQEFPPPPGVTIDVQSAQSEEQRFNNTYDKLYEEVLRRFQTTPPNEFGWGGEATLPRSNASEIKLEKYTPRGSKTTERRISIISLLPSGDNNPPGREFPYYRILYASGEGVEPKKTVITGSISPEGTIRMPEKREEFMPPIKEIQDIVDALSREFVR